MAFVVDAHTVKVARHLRAAHTHTHMRRNREGKLLIHAANTRHIINIYSWKKLRVILYLSALLSPGNILKVQCN